MDAFIMLVITFKGLWCWNLGCLHFLLTQSSHPKARALLWSWVQECNCKEIPFFLWLLGVACVPRAPNSYKRSQARAGRTMWVWFNYNGILTSHDVYWVLKVFLAQGILFLWFCLWSCMESMKIECIGNGNTATAFGFPTTGQDLILVFLQTYNLFYVHCFKSAWLRWKTGFKLSQTSWLLAKTPNFCLL